jgi:hypothetical protein
VQEVQAFGIEHGCQHGDAGDVAARAREARHETRRNRIVIREGHHDRNRARCGLERIDRGTRYAHHRIRIGGDQTFCQLRELFHAARARVEDEVAPFDDAGLGKLRQHDASDRLQLSTCGRQDTEPKNPALALCTSRKGQCNGRIGHKAEEFASPQFVRLLSCVDGRISQSPHTVTAPAFPPPATASE